MKFSPGWIRLWIVLSVCWLLTTAILRPRPSAYGVRDKVVSTLRADGRDVWAEAGPDRRGVFIEDGPSYYIGVFEFSDEASVDRLVGEIDDTQSKLLRWAWMQYAAQALGLPLLAAVTAITIRWVYRGFVSPSR